jgi:hypothetical protein
MTADQDFEREVTRIVGLVALLRPDLAMRVDNATLRRVAADTYRRPIPRVFRDAFR